LIRSESYIIDKMDCPVEEQLIQKRLAKEPGVRSLKFDLMNRNLTVEHELDSDATILKALDEIGMAPSAPDAEPSATPKISANWLLGIALVLALGSEIVGWVLKQERSWPVIGLSVLAILLSGRETFTKGLIAVRTLTLNINFLMSVAVVGALVIGSWPEAAMVTVLFAIAEKIEAYSLDRARNAVRSLMEMAPDEALRQLESGAWESVSVCQVSVGDLLRVKPGERIPLDGEVQNGRSAVNQAPITGESMPVEKAAGDTLFAGCINGEGVLEFRVTEMKGHTTLDRIIATVQEAQASRAPTQRFVDSFARVYTPIVFLVAVLVATLPLAFGQPFYPWLCKALVMLVIACPCALVISTPVTVVSGLAAAAHRGILIKGGAYLESGRHLKLVALDKTGTLTEGKPKLTDVLPLHGFDRDHALRIAASLEALSDHPIAQAIAREWQGDLAAVQNFESKTGRGVIGEIEGQNYILGNHRMTEEENVCCDHVHDALAQLESEGKTTVILANDKEAIAVFGVADVLRPESVAAVKELHALGVKTAILTGDNQRTAEAIALAANIDDVRAELLPTDKLAAIESYQTNYASVGMVGDGINDAPALAKASIGFAMGAVGTDTALETADVALMKDDLRKLPEFIHLSRKTASILTQNIAIALGIKAVFFTLALIGKSTLWMAVFADMGASLIVVANGLRMLKK